MPALPPAPTIVCEHPHVIDGDTLACRNLPAHVRLVGIDAPEMPGHCTIGRRCTPGDGQASKRAMKTLVGAGALVVRPQGYDRYDRILARVSVNGIDLGCRMIALRMAVRRYARLDCRRAG